MRRRAFRQFIKTLNRELRLDHLIRRLEGQGFPRPPFVDLRLPSGERLNIGASFFARQYSISAAAHGRNRDDSEIDLHILVDRGRIDIDMDLFEPGETRQPSGDAIVETRAMAIIRSQSCMALLARKCVHAEHAEPVLARRG